MARIEDMDLNFNIRFKIGFWQAVKLRLAGKAAQEMCKIIAEDICKKAEDPQEID
jgi:hypothetical protein